MITAHLVGTMTMRYAGPWALAGGTINGGTIEHYGQVNLKESATMDFSPKEGVRYRDVDYQQTSEGEYIELAVKGAATLRWKRAAT